MATEGEHGSSEEPKTLIEQLNEVASPPTLTSKFVAQSPRTTNYRSTRLLLISFLRSSSGLESVLRLIQYSLRWTIYLRRNKFTKPLLVNLLGVVSVIAASRRVAALIEVGRLARKWSRAQSAARKGKGKEIEQEKEKKEAWTELSIAFLIQGLDLVATIGGNIYLFGRHSLLTPLISAQRSPLADWVADTSTFISSLLGLVLVSRARKAIWREGRAVRRGLLNVEEKLDVTKFWEEEERDEERRLREKVRTERKVLKGLREELNELWWDRGRLIADALFAGYNTMEVQTGSEGVKSAAGIVSALISLSQTWNEHRRH